MARILFIAPHRPDRSPSQRFRFEQYLDFLKENGWKYDFSYLISKKDDQFFYKKGFLLKKIWVIIKSAFKRFSDLRKAGKYDVVFIQREAFPTGSTYFERRFSKKTKVIYDFDDAIWLSNVSDANKKWNWLKNPEKTKEIIRCADLIFAGNQYLANYAKKFNKNIVIVPTTIDTKSYKPMPKTPSNKITIGWSGSITTIQHFEYAEAVLIDLVKKYGDKLHIKVIGDKNYTNENFPVEALPWKAETEIRELCSFDIGIMPLPDDEWAKGKCGLKGLQYMALAVPTIMSPIGVNDEIIQDGENGFLASSKEEWIEKISLLIEDSNLRTSIGEKGRATVEEKYSINANKTLYLKQLIELVGE